MMSDLLNNMFAETSHHSVATTLTPTVNAAQHGEYERHRSKLVFPVILRRPISVYHHVTAFAAPYANLYRLR